MDNIDITNIDINGEDIWNLIDQLEEVDTEENKEVESNNDCCKECGSDNLDQDSTNGYLVCLDCGLKSKELLDRNPDWNSFNDGKNTNSRCGCPTNFFLPQSSLGTKVPMNFSYSKIARLQKWHQMPYKERSLNDVLQYITKVCKEHNVNGSIIDNARILFKQINDTKHLEGINEGKNIITRGRNRKSLISACVFVGSCLQGQPILPKIIAEIFSLEEKEVTRGCRNIREILKNNIIMRNLKPSQSHEAIQKKNLKKMLDLDEKHIDIAIRIAKNVKKIDIASDHQPSSVAAGSVMLMSEILNLNISKKSIQDTFKISQVTIMKTFRKIQPFTKVLIDNNSTNRVVEMMKKKELIETDSDEVIKINKEEYETSEDSVNSMSEDKNLISRYI